MSLREKYERRERTLYALLFDDGRVYVGQTIDPVRREYQHRRFWNRPFTMVTLCTMTGTEAEAEDWEYAWRYVAQQRGLTVVATNRGGDAFVLRSAARRMTVQRFAIAAKLRWPSQAKASPTTGLWGFIARLLSSRRPAPIRG